MLTLLLCIGGNVFYRNQKKNIRIEKYQELASIGKLKIDQIVNWRKERLKNAQNIFNNQAIITHISEYIHGIDPDANYRRITRWVNSILDEPNYSLVVLIDSKGKTILNTDPTKPLTDTTKHFIEEAELSKGIIFSDLFMYNDQKICMDMAIPLYLNPEYHKGFSGVVMLRIDPDKFLYPLIRSWPTPSRTSEMMLIRRKGDSVLYLSELQHKKNTALRLHIPITDTLVLAVQALKGNTGILEGIDYRGIKVLGDTHPVPGSPWYVVTKVDVDEIYQPIMTLAIWIFTITFLLILISALIIYVLWTLQLSKSERERKALLQHFDYVVKYANDIILLADPKGAIYEVNDKAVNTYGYTYKELLKHNLSLFQPIETKGVLNQQIRLLNEKEGFIYETVHISKHGRKFPVEVSGRIMDILGVKYIQLIIRDITERKQAQEEITIYQQHLQELVDEQTSDLKKLNQQLQQDITERKEAESRLRESEQRLSFHFENSPLAVVEWDADFNVTQWSKEAERIFGWKATETIGKHIASLNIIFEEDIPIVNHIMERLTSGNENVVVSSNRNYTQSGNIIECIWYNSILLDEAGKMASVMSLVEDVTERKKAENELRKLSRAVEQSPVSIVITDLEGCIEYGNPKVCAVTGYTPEELLGKKPNLFKSGETSPDAYQELWQTISSGKEWQGEFHNIKKNGDLYWEAASISPIMDAQGNITHFLAVKEDITIRKKAEEELKKAKAELEIRVLERTAELAKSEERFRSTLDNLMEGCMFIGHDWTYLWVNDSVTQQMHLTKEDLIGHSMLEIFPGVELTPLLEGFQVAMEKRISHHFIVDITFSDGCINCFDFHVEPVTEGIFVMSSDITERNLAIEKLRASEQGFRTLAESIPQFVWITEPDGMCIYFNEHWTAYTGMTMEESYGTGWNEPFHPDDKQLAWDAWKLATETGEHYELVCRLRQFDGEYHWFVNRGVPIRNSTGVISKWYGTCTNIDSQKEAEKEIKELNDDLEHRVYERTLQLQTANQELEAFSYSVSHDLRAPLRSIDGWSMALLEDCHDQLDAQGLQYLDRVRKETQHMGHLIDDLLKLSRVSRSELKKVKVDLTTLAQDITGRLQKSSSDRKLEYIIHPGMFTFGDPNMLEIALTNLLDNAYKFTSKQPVARIEFGQSVIEEKRTYWIRDNGVGFDMSYSKNLFGAFQRMHKQSDFPGTGIGLATVQRIIHRHDGHIWAESIPNQGTTFYFTLIEKSL